MRKTLVIVGCGAAKADESTAAKDIYTSIYFQKKRVYAEQAGDDWMILSAKHGLVDPDATISPYDTRIDDLDSDALDALAHDVGCTLCEWAETMWSNGHDIERIDVLAGQRYLDPLRKRDAFAVTTESPVVLPLQENDLSGIGEQMAWLSDTVEETDDRCIECGVTDRGGFLFEVDGETYCNTCAPAGECYCCGAETGMIPLEGQYKCRDCRQ